MMISQVKRLQKAKTSVSVDEDKGGKNKDGKDKDRKDMGGEKEEAQVTLRRSSRIKKSRKDPDYFYHNGKQ